MLVIGGFCFLWLVNVVWYFWKCVWYGIIVGFDRFNIRYDDNGCVIINMIEKKNIINYEYSKNIL